MVTLLTDYNTQRYILNSADDIGDLEFHNGDQVLLMDQDVLLIFDEENTTWYAVPTGGGGGGTSFPYIQEFSYVQAEDWLTDTNGNNLNFCNTYLSHGPGLYWGYVDQDLTDTYGAVNFFVGSGLTNGTQHFPQSEGSGWHRKNNVWAMGSLNLSTGKSWHIKSGAEIKVWYIEYSDIPGGVI